MVQERSNTSYLAEWFICFSNDQEKGVIMLMAEVEEASIRVNNRRCRYTKDSGICAKERATAKVLIEPLCFRRLSSEQYRSACDLNDIDNVA